MIENLPQNLSRLDDNELREARHDRDERMSLLFRSWPSLSRPRKCSALLFERGLGRHDGEEREL